MYCEDCKCFMKKVFFIALGKLYFRYVCKRCGKSSKAIPY